uniref:Low-density lipoprotein receptor-related protein 2-like n=1 Tax=Phallusia mammillata TaxID=59560 RepID=A0A6F9DJ70_9ASCI|nr:low-density lipoprotein receptor-related protein 2-like [Phallusia mammillata]
MVPLVLFVVLSWISIPQVWGSPGTATCRAEDGFFRCLNTGVCIPRYRVRSYGSDCWLGWVQDESDEDREPLNCTDDEFRCRSLQKCVPRYLLNTKESCKLIEGLILPCRNQTEFTCKRSKLCIPRWMVRNGKRDCDTMVVEDGSDETITLTSCDASEFSCSNDTSSSSQCIPREWVGNGVKDCANGRDEITNLTSCYNDTEFRCNTIGRCLARHRVINDFPDCPDGSDEKQALKCIPDKEFRCHDNGRCIPRSWRGNTFMNCNDGSDEIPWNANETCFDGEFRCHNGKRCIPTHLLCDGMNHCGDCSDEIESCTEPRMLRCPNEPASCVLPTYSCDEFADCPANAEDVKHITGFKCNKVVAGLHRTMYCVLPQWTLTDEYPICQDSSDLCFVNGTFRCHRCLYSDMIISPKQLCDGIFDCPDLTDECLCARNVPGSTLSVYLCDNVCYGDPGNPACSLCNMGQVKCGLEDVCISKSQVCDGKVDCSITKLDELYCGKTTNQDNGINLKKFHCDPIPQEISKALHTVLTKDVINTLVPLEATECNNVVECSRFEDECSERANCSIRHPVCDQIPMGMAYISGYLVGGGLLTVPARKCQLHFGFSFILGSSICNGFDECQGGHDEATCPGSFRCEAGKVEILIYGVRDRVSIPVQKTCDLISDCVNSTDELNCSESTHFYCLNKSPPYVPRTKVLDGVSDCSDSSSECPPNYLKNDALASNEQMIKIRALEILVWFMAVLALFGNLAVMINTALYFKEIKFNQLQNKVGLINNTMIFNLAIADLLMGIVLLVVGIKAVEFSGSYCLFDKLWRSSNLCNAIGAMTVISSETSVLTLRFASHHIVSTSFINLSKLVVSGAELQ